MEEELEGILWGVEAVLEFLIVLCRAAGVFQLRWRSGDAGDLSCSDHLGSLLEGIEGKLDRRGPGIDGKDGLARHRGGNWKRGRRRLAIYLLKECATRI